VRLTTTRWTAPLALLSLVAAGACRDGSGPRDAAARDALQRDLELAQSSAVALAPADRAPTRFVSALEAGEAAARSASPSRPSRRPAAKAPRARAEHAQPTVAAVTTAAAPGVAEAPAPAPVAASATTAAATTAESAPLIHEGESASPSDVGIASTGPGPYDGGGVEITRRGHGIGDAIGVVIRGGGIGDDDHCERDHPGSRMPYPMGRRAPGMGGITLGVPRSGIFRGTFPGRM